MENEIMVAADDFPIGECLLERQGQLHRFDKEADPLEAVIGILGQSVTKGTKVRIPPKEYRGHIRVLRPVIA